VAALARLELSDEEVERFREQLSAILEAVGKVAELDLSDVEPTAHPLDLVNVWADDEPRPCLPVDEALANAPDREGALFRGPAGCATGSDCGPRGRVRCSRGARSPLPSSTPPPAPRSTSAIRSCMPISAPWTRSRATASRLPSRT